MKSALLSQICDTRPQPTVYEEKPIQMIFIKASDAEPGQARQLPWVVRGPATPSTNWLAVLKHYTFRSSAKLPIVTVRRASTISKNFTLRLVRRVRLRHRAHQAQIVILDASLRTHSVRTPTLRVRAPQTPPGANPLHPPSGRLIMVRYR